MGVQVYNRRKGVAQYYMCPGIIQAAGLQD
jgi:hypothetical protein